MALILGSSSGTGNRFTLTGETALVPDYAVINSTDNDGIYSASGYNYVWVRGTVSGSSNAIQLGDTTSDNYNRIYVDQSGFLSGIYAVRIYGAGSHVINNGTIAGTNVGVYMEGVAGVSQTITNTGQLYGEQYGIQQWGGANVSVNNLGTIHGAIAIELSNGNDTVRNTGTLMGDALLGAGNDVFDSRGGTMLGTVYGMDGNDTFYNTAGVDVFNGGLGRDAINFAGSGAAFIYLDGREGGGSAAGDTFIDIEIAYGGSGADRITGNSAANTLYGRLGADSLLGGAGHDTLIGGLGIDVLTGGAGNDTFVFESLDDIGDRILDFGNGAGNNDVIRINGAAFGGGLVAGALSAAEFRTGNFNTAQDADDRFILRSSDKTLWFDADGAGGQRSVMVADLQDTAVFNRADIFIY